ncbi:MAG: hypothetical protein E6Z74_01995 [Clostridium perfringens]|uniref:hypothetical protein n=1 Tax=Clostridium perfringens TaxID=1502 RepID=UPI0024BC54E8|nr:hypothetical protein [Clostridium perfringens]EJT6495205.1 hypothetical protein [Clostridium perfringens]MDU5774685.1 hypothetical protein [Clostridium perfringens]
MTNSIILIETKADNRIKKLIVQKLKSALDCIEENIINEDEYVFVILDNYIKLELINKGDNIWIINLIGYKDCKKKKLIDLLNNDDIFKQVVFMFDTKSNKLVSENYKILHELEVKLRAQFCFNLMNNYGRELFDIIDKISVKEESRIENNIISNKFNTKLQRLDLSKLIDYMKENIWGGDEIEKLSLKINDIESFDEVDDEFKNLLNLDIFKDITKLIDNEKILIKTRNNICHNRIVHSDEFEKELEVLKKVNEEIDSLYYKSIQENLFVNKIKYSEEKNNEITLLIESDKEKINIRDIKLFFSRILTLSGYVFENIKTQTSVINNKKASGYIIQQNIGHDINFKLRYIYNNKETNLYLLRITYRNKDKILNSVANIRDEILKNINMKIILLNDTVSLYYSDILFSKFNYIENLLRTYIATYYVLNDIDLKGIESKSNSKNNDTLIDSNNPLFDLDFIKLGDILRDTPKGYKSKDIINEVKKSIVNKVDHIENLRKKLSNISDTNSNIMEIINKWDDLYKYRTIVAHNEYISKNEYEYVLGLVENIIDILEKIYYDTIIMENNDDEKILFKDELKKINIIMHGKDMKIRVNSNIYEFEGIGINELNKLMNGVIEGNVKEVSFVLTENAIKEYLNSKKEKIIDLIDKNNFDSTIKSIIKELKYTKYLKTRNITSREALLEEKIGELLVSISKKIKDTDDEFCATLI